MLVFGIDIPLVEFILVFAIIIVLLLIEAIVIIALLMKQSQKMKKLTSLVVQLSESLLQLQKGYKRQ